MGQLTTSLLLSTTVSVISGVTIYSLAGPTPVEVVHLEAGTELIVHLIADGGDVRNRRNPTIASVV